ncbi:MAG: hypothetical protein ACK520_03840 [Inhella sp.]|uniref:hypothetical protein n=1 Tax=Inhella sp. TaxID=1921806 RepID=UPI0022C54700|nr:hypothetical protein [Inhella sp.]MCZ8233557.1 hypothetical protein [Inhella sp.]
MTPLPCPPPLVACVLASVLLAPIATPHAQEAPPHAGAVPPSMASVLDATAPVPRPVTREAWRRWSALGLEPLPPLDWRAANAQVLRVGGWRTYAREPLPGTELQPTPTPKGEPR